MKLIVGLGNPGKEYQKNRHNIGFMIIDNIANKLNCGIFKEKEDGLYLKGKYNNVDFILLKPQKYVNLSGEVLRRYIDFFKIDVSDILVISDDLDLELGFIKLKQKGGTGGHNGLKNIESNLKTDQYKRLKIGISKNKIILPKKYVLENFKRDEEKIINQVIENASSIVLDFLDINFLELMNKYNRR